VAADHIIRTEFTVLKLPLERVSCGDTLVESFPALFPIPHQVAEQSVKASPVIAFLQVTEFVIRR
jgi:hypothetical protein